MKMQRYFQAFSQEELCSGAELVLSGEVKTSSCRLEEEEKEELFDNIFQEKVLRCLIAEYQEYQGKNKIKGKAEVVLEEEKEIVLRTHCTCSDYQKDRYGCSHVAAALTAWYMEQGGEDFFVGSKLETALKNRAMVEDPFAPGVMKRTDSRLLSFLRGSQEENSLPTWEEKESAVKQDLVHADYDILPVGNKYYLELKAGCGRAYIIKDLPGFLNIYREGGVYTFGKKDTLLSETTCDPFTNELLKILCSALEREERRSSGTQYFVAQGNAKDRRYFALTGVYFSELLELLNGGVLKFSDGSQVPVQLERKGLEAVLRKKSHGATLQIKKVTIFASGGTTCYFQDEQGIFSAKNMRSNESNILQGLLRLTEPLYVRESDIQALRQQILPLFENNGRVITKGLQLENYEREKPELELYLDLEGRSVISCTPYTHYRQPEERYRLFDNTSGTNHRNGPVENGFAQKLIGQFQSYRQETGKLYAELEEEQLYEFLQETIPVLEKSATLFVTDRLKRLKARSLPKLQVKLGVKASSLLLGLEGSELSKEELEEILSLYSPKKKFFRLKNGTFFHLEDADTEVWDTLSEVYKHQDSRDPSMMKLPLYRALYLNEMLLDREALVAEMDSHYEKLIRSMKAEEKKAAVPAELQEILRPYQTEGYRWIRRLKTLGFGGILADDMGLGKTLQVLAFLLSEKQSRKKKQSPRSLIICPASLVYNWQKELQRFTPELSCVVIAGTQAVRQELIQNSSETEVWITSYDLLKRDIALYEGISFANEIIDEAQFIKNQHTQAAQSVRIVSADFRMALTGTPIENHLGELWSILDYLMPGFLYSYSRFQKEYEIPIMSGQDEESMERLRRMVHPFILRRLKKDVLKELPEKLEESITVKLDGEQKRLYDAYAAKLRTSLAQKSNSEFRSQKIEILAELTRLRQLCCDPSLLVENYRGENAKLDACMELVSQAVEGGHKILLFSQFTSMLDIICQRLTGEGYAYYRIDGSVSKEKRMDMVDSFAYDEVPIFCISLKAGGTGLNLTAADIVIHYDPWWNQAAQNQATDRAHRIGQTQNVSVYELIAGDTIEEQIQNIKQEKARLMEDVLSGESISASTIDRDDLLHLLA